MKNLEMILVTFPATERAAIVLSDLKKIENQGSISIHEAAVLVKDENGKVSIRESGDPGVRRGAFFGSLLGAVVGLFGGGPPGALIGGAAGAVTGGATGVVDLGFDDETLKGLKESLPKGYSAILAVLEEENVQPMINELNQFEGRLYRQSLNESLAKQLRNDQENFSSNQNNF